jgi:hypothetical protein
MKVGDLLRLALPEENIISYLDAIKDCHDEEYDKIRKEKKKLLKEIKKYRHSRFGESSWDRFEERLNNAPHSTIPEIM